MLGVFVAQAGLRSLTLADATDDNVCTGEDGYVYEARLRETKWGSLGGGMKD